MRNKFIPTLIGVMVITASGGLAYWQHSQETPVPQLTQNGDASQTSYSFGDIASHNTASDCWAIINGGVYDLTSWVSQHPGGPQAIEGICGTDGSNEFNGQHAGGQAQQKILAELKIGVVRQ